MLNLGLLSAQAAQSELTEMVARLGLALSLLCFVVGVVALLVELKFINSKVKEVEAASNAAKAAGTLTEHGAVTSTMDSLAKLATALKDLKPSAQLFVLSMGFLAIAAVAAGLDAVAGAVSSS